MKVGIFSPYFETYGGGERYMLTAGEFFAKRGDSVDIFWKGKPDVEKIKDRFDINLSKANFREDIFFGGENFLKKTAETAKYDLLFFLSDGSIPVTFAKKNWIHFQVPIKKTAKLSDKLKILKFNNIICNSSFTKKFIDRSYGVKSVIVYPPVDTKKFSPAKKENIILTIGRFAKSNPKKHDIMIAAFNNLAKELKGWKFVILGTALPEDEEEVKKLKEKSGSNVEIISGLKFDSLKNYLEKSKIYWHAAGFGEDLQTSPEKAEHFGITTVEAMAAGCVPIVFKGGGQLEIVDEGKTGFFWETEEELISKTNEIIDNSNLQKLISAAAVESSKRFSKQNFFSSLEKLL